MTTNNINPSIPLNAIRDVLLDDLVLQGADYLAGPNRIFARRAPNGQTCPYIVIEAKEIPSSGISQFDTEMRVFGYAKLLANGQIDALGDLILYRCQELLNDRNISVTGMTTISLTTSVVPSFIDPDDPSRSRGVVRCFLKFGL
jgi:hypothetical protein